MISNSSNPETEKLSFLSRNNVTINFYIKGTNLCKSYCVSLYDSDFFNDKEKSRVIVSKIEAVIDCVQCYPFYHFQELVKKIKDRGLFDTCNDLLITNKQYKELLHDLNSNHAINARYTYLDLWKMQERIAYQNNKCIQLMTDINIRPFMRAVSLFLRSGLTEWKKRRLEVLLKINDYNGKFKIYDLYKKYNDMDDRFKSIFQQFGLYSANTVVDSIDDEIDQDDLALIHDNLRYKGPCSSKLLGGEYSMADIDGLEPPYDLSSDWLPISVSISQNLNKELSFDRYKNAKNYLGLFNIDVKLYLDRLYNGFLSENENRIFAYEIFILKIVNEAFQNDNYYLAGRLECAADTALLFVKLDPNDKNRGRVAYAMIRREITSIVSYKDYLDFCESGAHGIYYGTQSLSIENERTRISKERIYNLSGLLPYVSSNGLNFRERKTQGINTNGLANDWATSKALGRIRDEASKETAPLSNNKSFKVISDELLHIAHLNHDFIKQQKRIIMTREEMEENAQLGTVDRWMNMTPRQFETEVCDLFIKCQGYSGYVTSYIGDGGVDIYLYKDNEKIAVQCKYYKNNTHVTPAEIRQLIGSVAIDKDCTGGFFVSTNWYSRQAKSEAERGNIKIFELKDLVKMEMDWKIKHNDL